MSFSGIFKARKRGLALGLSILACGVLAGCDLFDEPVPVDVPKPVSLHPDGDVFSNAARRTYEVTKGVTRGKKDSILNVGAWRLDYLGDTTLASSGLARKVALAYPSEASLVLPAEVFTQLGLNPGRFVFDAQRVLDPGAGIRFPDTPKVGWTLDTTVGELRRVRELTDVQTLLVAGLHQQCWVFKESTYWGGAPVSTGTYWMGATGLVKHRREWKSWTPSGINGGTLWREVKAL